MIDATIASAPEATLDANHAERAAAAEAQGIPWADLLMAVLGLRILISLVGAGVRLLLPQPHQSMGFANLVFEPWRQFDTLRFIEIAAHGYQTDSLNTAYLPLYPLLVRGASFITAGHYLTAGLIVSNVACVIGVGLFWRWVADRFSTAVAWRSVAVLLLFPDSFYLLSAYSESLFLALSAGCLLASGRGHSLLAGVLATAAVLTRLQGLVLVVPMALDYWRNRQTVAARPLALLSLAAPIAALLAYQKLLTTRLGGSSLVDTFQHKWHITLQAPWQTIRQYVTVIRSPQWHLINSPKANYILLWDLLIGLIVLAVILLCWRRLGLELSLYGLASWCFAMSRWYSTGRYMLAVLPVFIAVALWADGKRLRRITMASILLLVFLTAEFAQGNWVD